MPPIRRPRAAVLAALGTLWAGAWTRAPLAQTTELEQAQTLVYEASRLFGARDYEGALTQLRSAETIAAKVSDSALPQIRFNIARCLDELGRSAEALAAYQRYIELPDEGHRKDRAWKAMQALEQQVFGRINVTCVPAGATISSRGMSRGDRLCPWSNARVEPGRYSVTISHPGHVTETRAVTVEAGQSVTLEVVLGAEAPAVPVAPVAPPPVAVTAPPPPPRSTGAPIGSLLAVGAGVAAIGAGVYLTMSAIDNRDTAQGLPPGGARRGAVDDFERNRGVSYVTYAVGGAALVAGIALWIAGSDGQPAAIDAHAVEPVGGWTWRW